LVYTETLGIGFGRARVLGMNRLAPFCFWIAIAVLGIGSMLSGCGYKGDLYLPDNPSSGSDEEPS
jgi:hypothetical protein